MLCPNHQRQEIICISCVPCCYTLCKVNGRIQQLLLDAMQYSAAKLTFTMLFALIPRKLG